MPPGAGNGDTCAPDVIIEVERGHVVDMECVMHVGVLVGGKTFKQPVVDCGHDVQMVVGSDKIGEGHVIETGMSIQCSQLRARMLQYYVVDVGVGAEI